MPEAGDTRRDFRFRLLTGGYTVGMSAAAHLYSWWAQQTRRWPHESAMERWGRAFPVAVSKSPIWIHAASMGEARVAGQFARELAAHGCSVIASSMTESGYKLSNEVYPCGTPYFRVPLDIPGPLRHALAHFQPAALVLVETEWWPNLLLESSHAGLHIFVVNGRISERALRRYRLGRKFWKTLLSTVECFYMRSQLDADRLRELGVEPERIKVSGSLKAMIPPDPRSSAVVPSALHSTADLVIWIAGCTRPGEEEIVLEAFTRLRTEFPKLRLWLAPRHPDRFDDVAHLILRAGFPELRWSKSESMTGEAASLAPVVLVDQMGSLATLYLHATVAFIGGSLKPFGGHNPLEPALAGAPVIFGPHMEDQQDAATLLLRMGLAVEVKDAAALAGAVAAYLRTPRSTTQRSQYVEQLMNQYSHVRAEVAADLCARVGSPSSATVPASECAAARA